MNFNPFDLLKNPAALKEKLEQVQENLKILQQQVLQEED